MGKQIQHLQPSAKEEIMEQSEDILGNLTEYFADGICRDDLAKVRELHSIFQRDFFETPVKVDGKTLKVKPYKYNRCKKDSLPDEYSSFYEKFVHVITRKVKANNWKTAPEIREFRPERANRVHWIRPIIEYCNDTRITRFKYTEANGTQREYFWFRAKQYMVILEEINPDYTLITGFCVDPKNQPDYQNKFINRDRQK